RRFRAGGYHLGVDARTSAAAAAFFLLLGHGCGERDRASEEASTGPRVTTTVRTVTAAPTPRFPRARRIAVPNGFRAQVYARGLTRPTAMAFGPDARLYVTEEGGRVVRVPARSRRPRVAADGFQTPLGLVWRGGTLFVSSQGRLDALTIRGGREVHRRTVVAGLPYGLHQQDNVVVGDDGRLYFGSGSTCNACVEADPRSATILSVRPDGRDLRVVSTGLRNPFGLAVHPESGDIFASVNARDDLGDEEPAESVVVVRQGRDFGWPDCWPSWRKKRLEGDCDGVAPHFAYLEPHSSADGMAFWRGALYVALWGQYASDEHGRRVDRVDLETGGVAAFADGFDHPLAVAVDELDALLVADWGRGVVYRIAEREDG
ncbi:MAG: PQQ-dependent sugar dehydrogenase, partial [Actinobacteria bacterium]|nr:PQQ-dependent sugar dehydrogenase [Actinomycetota bacterium]